MAPRGRFWCGVPSVVRTGSSVNEEPEAAGSREIATIRSATIPSRGESSHPNDTCVRSG